MDFSFGDFLIVSASSLAVVVALMVATAVLTKVTGRVSVVDTVWGLGFIVVTLAAFGVGELASDASSVGDHNDRTWFLAVMVVVWGGRLAWHIGKRSRGAGE